MEISQHLEEIEKLKAGQRHMAGEMDKVQMSWDQVNCCWEQVLGLRLQPVPSALLAGGSAPWALLDAGTVLPAEPCQPG